MNADEDRWGFIEPTFYPRSSAVSKYINSHLTQPKLKAVDCALYHTAGADLLQRDERIFRERLVVDSERHGAETLAVADGCIQHLLDREPRLDAVRHAARERDVQILRNAERHECAVAEPDARFRGGPIRGIDETRLEIAKAVVEQALARADAPAVALGAEHSGDQARLLVLRGGDQTPPGVHGVAGLHAVDRVIAPQEPIAVVMRDL